MFCNELTDVSFMMPHEQGQKIMMPCLAEACWLLDDDILNTSYGSTLCQQHYEHKVYRKDPDVARYVKVPDYRQYLSGVKAS